VADDPDADVGRADVAVGIVLEFAVHTRVVPTPARRTPVPWPIWGGGRTPPASATAWGIRDGSLAHSSGRTSPAPWRRSQRCGSR
jgi:hypothetical protein